jgi:hypothetical protein
MHVAPGDPVFDRPRTGRPTMGDDAGLSVVKRARSAAARGGWQQAFDLFMDGRGRPPSLGVGRRRAETAPLGHVSTISGYRVSRLVQPEYASAR